MGSKRALARKKGRLAHFFQNIVFYIPGVPMRKTGATVFMETPPLWLIVSFRTPTEQLSFFLDKKRKQKNQPLPKNLAKIAFIPLKEKNSPPFQSAQTAFLF